MATTLALPTSQEELFALGMTDGLARFPARMEEYWDLLESADYRADYHQHEIILTMSYETNLHSRIVTYFLARLLQLYSFPDWAVHNSNRPVYIEESDSVFNPDGCVAPPDGNSHEFRKGMSAETEPVVLLEVLSKNTAEYDLDTKLPCYKKIASLRHIIYLDSRQMRVTHHQRVDVNPTQWLTTDYDQPEQSLVLEGQPILLKDLYQGIF